MKEKIVFAPGCSGTEMVRSLARWGISTIGMRIMGSVELAKTALMKSGIAISEEYISSREAPSVISSFIREIPYFQSASYADAEKLYAALTALRGMVVGDEEKEIEEALHRGPFQDKNDAILNAYTVFMKECKKNELIDSMGIVRKALSEAKPIDADFICLREYPLTPLETALLEKLSNGAYTTISLRELYKTGKTPGSGFSYVEGYGSVNEIEDILDQIYREKLPLDSCVIACPAGSVYPQTVFDFSKQYQIPVTFGCGVPIGNTYPAMLLKAMSFWDNLGYHGIDALKEVLTSRAFDRRELEKALGFDKRIRGSDIDDISKMAGSLRISTNAVENTPKIDAYEPVLLQQKEEADKKGIKKNIRAAERKLLTFEWVKKLSKELETGFVSFFDKYAVLRDGTALRIDQSAKSVITENLTAYQTYAAGGDLNTIIPQILNKTVSSESSRPGFLHLTSVHGALASMRENLFVCGLSADIFPGTPTENYLLLDEDLKQFGLEFVPTSTQKIRNNKEALDHLLALAAGLGVCARLSFSGYDTAELKEKNPSSVLFGYYEKEHPGKEMKDFRKEIRKAEYFKAALSKSRLVGENVISGKRIDATLVLENEAEDCNPLEKDWSPSALDIFFQCPRRFYLTRILEIPEEEPDDPFEVISAADFGTLAHSMMERLAENRGEKEDFLKDCDAAFEDFLIGRPPLHRDEADLKKKEFCSMMENAYVQEMQARNVVLKAEEEYKFEHSSGVKLHGYPDRVEKDGSEKYIIADFKTKRRVEHEADDIETCLQVVIYAWLCEQNGIPVSKCEYRYLRKNQIVSCIYDEGMRAKLDEKLEEFKKAIEEKDFPRKESPDNCRYCKMADICRMNDEKTGGAGDEC